MESSPKGRVIEYVDGSPDGIIERGDKIKTLGGKMLDSADILEAISTGALEYGGQQGKAIDKLRDTIDDSYTTLRKAGELYQPVGPVIGDYGRELQSVQPLIRSAVDDCEDLWVAYQNEPGDKDGSLVPEADGGFLGIGGHDADSPEAQKEADKNLAALQAYNDWHQRAEDFDTHYDTWEDAFDTAVDGISDEMAGAIEDSFWSTLTDWLEIAALVVGIAALIIGGPIAAAVALAVGAALLIATIVSYTKGERGKWDIALAAVSILPLGKLSSLSKMSHLTKGAAKVPVFKSASGVGNLGGLSKATKDLVTKGKVFHADGLVGIFKNRGAASGFRKILTGSEEGFTSVYRTHKSFYEGPGAILRLQRGSDFTRKVAQFDYGVGVFSTSLSNYAHVDRVFLDSLPNIDLPKPIQFVL